MQKQNMSIKELEDRLEKFAEQRDWKQYHSPKNLSMALIGEAAELTEHFQWLTEEQSFNLSGKRKNDVSMEIADIFIFLLRMTRQLDIDLIESVLTKMAINEKRFPAEEVKGQQKRFVEYIDEK